MRRLIQLSILGTILAATSLVCAAVPTPNVRDLPDAEITATINAFKQKAIDEKSRKCQLGSDSCQHGDYFYVYGDYIVEDVYLSRGIERNKFTIAEYRLAFLDENSF